MNFNDHDNNIQVVHNFINSNFEDIELIVKTNKVSVLKLPDKTEISVSPSFNRERKFKKEQWTYNMIFVYRDIMFHFNDAELGENEDIVRSIVLNQTCVDDIEGIIFELQLLGLFKSQVYMNILFNYVFEKYYPHLFDSMIVKENQLRFCDTIVQDASKITPWYDKLEKYYA